MPRTPGSPLDMGLQIDLQLSHLARGVKCTGTPDVNKIAMRMFDKFRAAFPELTFVSVAPSYQEGDREYHPDAVMRDPENQLWVADWKTHKRALPSVEDTPSIQFGLYGKQIGAVGWIAVRGLQRLPAIPRLLKNGRVQAPSSCGLTDRETYLQAIEFAGHNQKHYQKELEKVDGMKLDRIDSGWFTPGYLDAIDREYESLLVQLENRNAPVFRNIKPGALGCDGCHYKTLCHTELITGLNQPMRDGWKETMLMGCEMDVEGEEV